MVKPISIREPPPSFSRFLATTTRPFLVISRRRKIVLVGRESFLGWIVSYTQHTANLHDFSTTLATLNTICFIRNLFRWLRLEIHVLVLVLVLVVIFSPTKWIYPGMWVLNICSPSLESTFRSIFRKFYRLYYIQTNLIENKFREDIALLEKVKNPLFWPPKCPKIGHFSLKNGK